MSWIAVTERMPTSLEPVLVAVIDDGKLKTLRAVYARRFELIAGEEFEGCEYRESDEDDHFDWHPYCPAGWYEWNEYEETHWKVGRQVTHWQPMPDPPDEHQALMVEAALAGFSTTAT